MIGAAKQRFNMRQKPLAHRLEDHQVIVGAATRITERSLECEERSASV